MAGIIAAGAGVRQPHPASRNNLNESSNKALEWPLLASGEKSVVRSHWLVTPRERRGPQRETLGRLLQHIGELTKLPPVDR